MFTGIIEARGHIAAVEELGGDRRMTIMAAAADAAYLADVQLGGSVAVNGICLTAVALPAGGFVADLSRETLDLTTSGRWTVGTAVNLEKALSPSTPLGGHFVTGHVDGLATLVSRHEDARSWRLRFAVPAPLARYIARKGSVTLNGVSLTVNDVEGVEFSVNIVPHTLEHTTLGELRPGDALNIEVDLLARYMERLLSAREIPTGASA